LLAFLQPKDHTLDGFRELRVRTKKLDEIFRKVLTVIFEEEIVRPFFDDA